MMTSLAAKSTRTATLVVAVAILIASAATARADHAPTVKLIDAGTGKKQPLRYRLRVGHKETATIQFASSTELRLGPDQPVGNQQVSPGIEIKLDLSLTKKASAADALMRFDVHAFRALGRAGLSSAQLAAAQKLLDNESKPRGNVLLTNRGTLAKPDGDSGTDGNAAGANVADGLELLLLPLPLEPVGTGATWTTQIVRRIGKTRLQIEMTFKLISFDGRCGKVAITASKNLTGGSPFPPSIKLLARLDSGSGTAEFDLDKIASNMSLTIQSDYELETDDEDGMPVPFAARIVLTMQVRREQ